MSLCLVRNPGGGISIEDTKHGNVIHTDGHLYCFGIISSTYDRGEVLKLLDTENMLEAIDEAEELRLLDRVMNS